MWFQCFLDLLGRQTQDPFQGQAGGRCHVSDRRVEGSVEGMHELLVFSEDCHHVILGCKGQDLVLVDGWKALTPGEESTQHELSWSLDFWIVRIGYWKPSHVVGRDQSDRFQWKNIYGYGD